MCGGTLKEGFAPDHITRRGYHLIVDQVPALVCTQCRSPFFDSQIIGWVEEAVAALDLLDDRLKAFAKARDSQAQPEPA
jgi:YgiT-type zinc finger domain-containing protein